MNKIKITGIDHIKMGVINIEETYKFYKNLFDFNLLEGDLDSFCIIGNDQVKICLHHEDPPTIYHFGFHVENYEEIPAICEAEKTFCSSESKWEHSNSYYLNEPNGYEVELSKFWGGGIINSQESRVKS
ncbi:MAG: VOC family protein [Saprospiraceae bacterium]|nr:VOC family protein [Saprospiraceae bacterium]